jgi:hypothetical protein
MSDQLLGAEVTVVKEKRARGGGGSPFLPDPRAKDDSIDSQFARLSGMLEEEDAEDKDSLLGRSAGAGVKRRGVASILSCCSCCSDE